MLRIVLTLAMFAALAACDADENDIRAASETAAAAALTDEALADAKQARDFDAIAEDALADVDTSGLGALSD